MIESYCRVEIWNKCREATGKPKYFSLNGSGKTVWEFEQFYDGMSGYNIMFRFDRKYGLNKIYRHAVAFISRNGGEIGQLWINEVFDGNWLKAIRHYQNFNEMFDAFEKYFKERRNAFLGKTEELIKAIRPDIANIKQIKTNSHGGVANLLKVLTRTMNEQGSSIQSIAKMQYCVCTQAGIYLPDEFITDVMTAIDMNNGMFEDKGRVQK